MVSDENEVNSTNLVCSVSSFISHPPADSRKKYIRSSSPPGKGGNTFFVMRIGKQLVRTTVSSSLLSFVKPR